jgi:hypothetical protein
MTLSKIIVECFVNNLSLEELREFTTKVIIPQNATTLLEHAAEAEKILSQGYHKDVNKKNKSKKQNAEA